MSRSLRFALFVSVAIAQLAVAGSAMIGFPPFERAAPRHVERVGAQPHLAELDASLPRPDLEVERHDRIEPVQGAVDAQEDLVGEVFGQMRVLEQSGHVAVDPVVVMVEEPLERLRIPPAHALQLLPIEGSGGGIAAGVLRRHEAATFLFRSTDPRRPS